MRREGDGVHCEDHNPGGDHDADTPLNPLPPKRCEHAQATERESSGGIHGAVANR